MRYLTMSNKEREQVKVLERLKLKEITQKEAAATLRMSSRWVRERLKRYVEKGDVGLILTRIGAKRALGDGMRKTDN